MHRAVELAACGLGFVEPNPQVGAVIVDDCLNLIAEGFHERFGGPHAEVNALRQAGDRAAGGTLFVTLEPCRHDGKTPPCTTTLIKAGLRKVVVGMKDPAPHNDGAGIEELRTAGIDVELGLLNAVVARLTATFVKRVTTGHPYVHAKWAMTLDGKIASRTGDSRWISNEASRKIGHTLRGRMDAILIGQGTATADDPLLTARPPGPRTAARIVLDSRATLPLTSKLVLTVDDAPLLVVVSEAAPATDVERLRSVGAEVLTLPSECVAEASGEASCRQQQPDLTSLLDELGRREMTNVLVEGGGRLLGSFFDQDLIDECHVFVAPKLLGGWQAISPIAGLGLQNVPQLPQMIEPDIEIIGGDVYIHGPLCKEPRQ